MKLVVATPPASEPVTTAEAKLHLRVDVSADDDLIASLVSAARRSCEAELGQSLVSTTWDLHLDRWPRSAEIVLPIAPLVSVTSITYYDSSNVSQTWSSSEYDVSTGSPGRVVLGYGYSYPTLYDRPDAVRIRFVAGYGTASDVPDNLKAAIKLLTGTLYENRESVVVGTTPAELPDGVQRLLGASRHGKYA